MATTPSKTTAMGIKTKALLHIIITMATTTHFILGVDITDGAIQVLDGATQAMDGAADTTDGATHITAGAAAISAGVDVTPRTMVVDITQYMEEVITHRTPTDRRKAHIMEKENQRMEFRKTQETLQMLFLLRAEQARLRELQQAEHELEALQELVVREHLQQQEPHQQELHLITQVLLPVV